MAELKTWRQRIATPLKRDGDEKPGEKPSDKLTNRTNPDLLRVSLSGPVIGQTPSGPDKPLVEPRLVRTGPNTWVEAEWARELCVFCPAPLAKGDVIACDQHRGTIDGLVLQALA